MSGSRSSPSPRTSRGVPSGDEDVMYSVEGGIAKPVDEALIQAKLLHVGFGALPQKACLSLSCRSLRGSHPRRSFAQISARVSSPEAVCIPVVHLFMRAHDCFSSDATMLIVLVALGASLLPQGNNE